MDNITPDNIQTPVQQPASPTQAGPHGGSTGPTIGIAIIVALLIAGGVYFWMDAKEAVAPTEEQSTTETSSQAGAEDIKAAELSQTSSSDSANSIEADLQATDLGDIDAEMSATGSQI